MKILIILISINKKIPDSLKCVKTLMEKLK